MASTPNHPSPPSPDRVAKFLQDAENIVGSGNVSHDASHGALKGLYGSDSYGDPFSISKNNVPGGAVRPSSVAEVQQIIRAANDAKVPLWTVSRGKNIGVGGSAPVVSGSVVVDLHRMNKIIEISEEFAYAIVEPGVSFQDLFDEIKRRGLKLWMSVPSLGWGSIVGNTLDRGLGYTPQGVHCKSQCGMEVVLPNGDVLRTGMGAMEGNKAWGLYSEGFGPGLDGLFFQSNLGIVTKMGVHLTPAPEAYTRILVDVDEDQDMIPLIDAMTDLVRRGVIHNPPQLVDRFALLFVQMGPDQEVYKAMGSPSFAHRIPEDVVNTVGKRLNLPAWRASFALYGPPEIHSGSLEAIKRRMQAVKGARVFSETFTAPAGSVLRGEDTAPDMQPQNGVPGLELAQSIERLGGEGTWHHQYSPVIPGSGREVYEWYAEARRLVAEHDLTIFADFHVFDRYLVAMGLISFPPSAKDRIADVQLAMTEHGKKRGLMEYRSHVSFMDLGAACQDFNGGAFGRFTRLLKDVVDPNGVLSPGKSGIWNSEAGPKL
ncbi:Vanillyl-alcohol oxidase [Colletotrichum spinosum]|uniref:Vanillyl-alcohol oxidase n=1 Tax=Colletotrichum spinosum TaxID=1347390 RepID=A0A4R8Q1Z9_9PEZI|nr:Vanillyl-alcohol oxidase [Colletotrichum spinosum]